MEKETQLNTVDYKTELEKNGTIAFVPGGNSMWPLLKNHGQSVIIVKKPEKLKKYDVIFYIRQGGAFVLHRILECRENYYVVCGDSQFTLEKVTDDQIFGIMEGFYHGKDYIKTSDQKYLKKVDNWYRHKTWRKIRLKVFFLKERVKNKLKRIFGKK